MTRNGDKWTDEEERQLLQKLRLKKSLSDIAREHERTERAIQMRMEFLAKKLYKSTPISEIASIMNQSTGTIEEWIEKETVPPPTRSSSEDILYVLKNMEKRMERLDHMVDKIYKRLKTREK